jgi:primosomal protein N'
MHVVHVIPIARGIGKETLSYFTAKPPLEGSIVSVPLRKRTVRAVVIAHEEVREAKSSLRQSRYPLRKAGTLQAQALLSPEFMQAVKETARHFVGTTGATLSAITPTLLWKERALHSFAPPASVVRPSFAAENERLVLQAETDERMARFRSIVRESFARHQSTIICVPSVQEGEFVAEQLGKGISAYVFVFHGSLTKKELLKRWSSVRALHHPVVIVCTPPFLAIERGDVSTIIIEHEDAPGYKQVIRPYIDLRFFIERVARAKRIRLILAGLPLSIETRYRHEKGVLEALIPLKLHPRSSVDIEIADVRTTTKPTDRSGKEFQALGVRLKQLIEYTTHTNRNLFIFVARRGLAPLTVCGDCGNPVTCEGSNEPAVLYRGLSGNLFVCHSTGESRSAQERCRVCGSWRLQSIGIGAQRLEDEIDRLFPKAQLFTLESTTVRTHAQAKTLVEKFYKTKGGILLGTEMALPYLTKPISAVAAASVDTLLSHPEWCMSEKTFALLLSLRDRASEAVLIQTRRPEEKIIQYALEGDTTRFYREELEWRKLLHYPPFTTLIKISTRGSEHRIHAETEFLENHFADYKLHIYLPVIHSTRSWYSVHGLLRVPENAWPDEKLHALLSELPPHFSVTVNPRQLLSN